MVAAPSIDKLRDVLADKGFIRTQSLGESYAGPLGTVVIGANEIVLVSSPSVHRTFQRASGGLLLAIEYIMMLE
jgi:hypothetical protein